VVEWGVTEASNVVDELADVDLFAIDPALREAVAAAGAGWAAPGLHALGAAVGSAASAERADRANRFPPELRTHDRRGRRVDRVEFHPDWHALTAQFRAGGWVALPHVDARPGRWVASLAAMHLHGQVEAGTLCPIVMTWAAIPLVQREPALWAAVGDRLVAAAHDPRELPIACKASIAVGMGMTEKQGGSDVRANATRATPLGAGGRGDLHALHGHKWFFSAPQCDAHLVVAKTPDGAPSCFWVPRLREDGSGNGVRLQRLKDKVGNRSNASAEVEFEGAHGVLVGEPGRGIATIVAMAGLTRLCCAASSAAFLRRGLVQALWNARHRHAFGRPLAAQPLMRAVLVDLALESEAALRLAMRLGRAFESAADPRERAWTRIATPAAKFWICKRAVEATGEAMEALGGNGYVEDGSLGRLYRESPVNSIWEGSGNVMALDLLRAIARDPDGFHAVLDEAAAATRGDAAVAPRLAALRAAVRGDPAELEGRGRVVAQELALVLQAALLRREAPAPVADAFVATRFGQPAWGRVPGAIDTRGLAVDALLERALPA
jgi:putative acyl-CoA dehydrogenase